MYTQQNFSSCDVIHRNKMKMYWWMFLTTVIIGILGCIISTIFHFGLTGTGCFLIGAGIVDFVAYYYSDKFIIKSENAKPISEEQIPQLYDMVRTMCEKNNLKMPRLYLIDTQAMNAFATGRNADLAIVAVTRGLLEKLSPEEISGVIGHELAHIESQDMKIMSVLSILSGLICILADMFWTSAMGNASEKDESGIVTLIGLALSLFAPITSMLIKLSVSRTREFSADARGAEIAGNPHYLPHALEKMKRDRIKVPHVSKATAHLYFASPFKDDVIGELFSTHPDIDERINRLLNMNLQ